MQFELSTGYKIWITKLGKNKKYEVLVLKNINPKAKYMQIILTTKNISVNMILKV